MISSFRYTLSASSRAFRRSISAMLERSAFSWLRHCSAEPRIVCNELQPFDQRLRPSSRQPAILQARARRPRGRRPMPALPASRTDYESAPRTAVASLGSSSGRETTTSSPRARRSMIQSSGTGGLVLRTLRVRESGGQARAPHGTQLGELDELAGLDLGRSEPHAAGLPQSPRRAHRRAGGSTVPRALRRAG